MVWRILFCFLFYGSVWASPVSSSIDSKTAYYGQEFFEQLDSGKSELKETLHRILHQAHIVNKGGYDKITPDCSGGNTCYRHIAIGYKRAREVLFGDFYLVQKGNSYGVEDVYCDRVIDSTEFRGQRPGPDKIPDHRVVNAEHTWPQSQFSSAFSSEMQKSDLHHLFPTDSELNSKRSSLEFGEVEFDSERLKCSESRLGRPKHGKGVVFEPPEDHKGNVARALFYFATRYKMRLDPEEEATLRAWHELDPVDEEEAERNERIFELQKTRNPFIDFPQAVAKVRDF